MRRLEIMDGEQYSKDMAVLWAAYKAGSFNLPKDLSQEDFVQAAEKIVSNYGQMWVVDDECGAFKDGKGPIAIVGTNVDGLQVMAEGQPFRWAKKKHLIRASVAFLQMIRYSKKTGVCFVKGAQPQYRFLRALQKYDVLHYIGKVDDNGYLFSVRGRGSDG